MSKIVIYNHGGSGNHGCEALIRTALNLVKFNENNIVVTESPQQDIHYKVNEIAQMSGSPQS